MLQEFGEPYGSQRWPTKFGPLGRWFAEVRMDKWIHGAHEVYVYDTAEREYVGLAAQPEPGRIAKHIEIDSTSRRMAVALAHSKNFGGELIVWDLDTGTWLFDSGLLEREMIPRQLALSEGGPAVAMAGSRETVVWVLGADPLRVAIPHALVDLLAFSKDGRIIATASSKRARVWEAATGRPVTRWLDHRRPLAALAFLEGPKGPELAGISASGESWLWSLTSSKPIAFSTSRSPEPASFAVSPSASLLAIARPDEGIRVRSLRAADDRDVGELMNIAELYAHRRLGESETLEPLDDDVVLAHLTSLRSARSAAVVPSD